MVSVTSPRTILQWLSYAWTKTVSGGALEEKAVKSAIHASDRIIRDHHGASRRPFRQDRDARGRGVRWTRWSQPWCVAVAICPCAKEDVSLCRPQFQSKVKMRGMKGIYVVRAPYLPGAAICDPWSYAAQANQLPLPADCSTCDPTTRVYASILYSLNTIRPSECNKRHSLSNSLVALGNSEPQRRITSTCEAQLYL